MNPPEASVVAKKELLKEARIELLQKGHHIRISLDGYSMFPLLLPKDEAVVRPLNGKPPVLGDIALIELPEKWIAHRVVQIKSEGTNWIAVSQGDSLVQPDRVVNADKIVGVVSQVFRDDRELAFDSGWRGITGKLMVKLRPFPQAICRTLLKIKRLFDKLAAKC